MKRMVLGLSIMVLLSTSSQAFPTGVYECTVMMNKAVITLKDNGRAKMVINKFMDLPETLRGYWQDDDDAAIIIRNDNVITQVGKEYKFNDIFPCKKIK